MFSIRRPFLGFLIIFFFQAFAHAGSSSACAKINDVFAHDLIIKTKNKKQTKQFKETQTKFSKFTPFSLTGKREGRMIEVQTFDGQITWVRKRSLTYSIQCLLVRVNKSRLRLGPGKDFLGSETALKGDVFQDHGGEDGWTQVESPTGLKAWINLDHTWKPVSQKMRMSFDPLKD